jgi:hypothetical protein
MHLMFLQVLYAQNFQLKQLCILNYLIMHHTCSKYPNVLLY